MLKPIDKSISLILAIILLGLTACSSTEFIKFKTENSSIEQLVTNEKGEVAAASDQSNSSIDEKAKNEAYNSFPKAVFEIDTGINPHEFYGNFNSTKLLYIDLNQDAERQLFTYDIYTKQIENIAQSQHDHFFIDTAACNDRWIVWVERFYNPDVPKQEWHLCIKNRQSGDVQTIKKKAYTETSDQMFKLGLEYRPDSYVLAEDEIYLIYPDILDDQVTSNVTVIQLTSMTEIQLQSADIQEIRFASCSIDPVTQETIVWSALREFNDEVNPLTYYKYSDIVAYHRSTKKINKITQDEFVVTPQVHNGRYYGLCYHRVSADSMMVNPYIAEFDSLTGRQSELITAQSSYHVFGEQPCSIYKLFSNQNYMGWWENPAFPVLYRYADGQVIQIYDMPDSPKKNYTILDLTQNGAVLALQPEFDSEESIRYCFVQLN